ncbi:c-type cytochrome [Roseobacter sinensis]|uniref:Cytochrome c n=1 Tax=Roseobacter sinensis TaxID=2931391 RepID=A0ABT3BHN4_9RHOB|nr:cytochrome c [Roseobacter sp. WL0113]MCV3273093.1 cytochrome c [Roseobacter sp. WL0113]
MRHLLTILLGIWLALPGRAEEALRLAVPDVLETSGFAQYLVPRFVLKTGVRITRVGEAEPAEMRFVTGDRALFEGVGQRWGLAHEGDPRAERFADWLRSEIGRKTIESFTAPDGRAFVAVKPGAVTPVALSYAGDRAAGERLSLQLCGRCHVINESNRMNGMGATPSFAVLRALTDWDDRFATFHLRNPHPSFTQIAEVTEPFDPSLPPPIVPLEMTQADLEAILAYVSGLDPADLGAPLHVQ